MEWPIKLTTLMKKLGKTYTPGKCEEDTYGYYTQGKTDQGSVGDMWRVMGWMYAQRPLKDMPFKNDFVWWRWGNEVEWEGYK